MEDPQLQQSEEEAAASSQISSPPPSSSSSSPSDDLFLAGFVIADVVGLRHYSGTVSGREPVGLVRDPYDPNAIKVFNTRTQQVGHIECSAAAVLSPLIDSGLITVEGIVPEPSHGRSPFKLPCQIHIFTPPNSMETLRLLISEGGLQVISHSDPSFTALSEAVTVKKKDPKKDIRNLDQIFAAAGAGENGGKKRKVAEPPKDIISSELFLHQKEALAWLIERENSCDLPPFWAASNELAGFYVNVLTNFQTEEQPEPLQGGIFADDMGLGKTLTLLSLIATNRPDSVVPPFIEISDDTVENGIEKSRNDEEKVPDSDRKNSRPQKSAKRVVGSGGKRKTDVIDDDALEDRVERIQNSEEELAISKRKKSQVEKLGKRVAASRKKNRKIDDDSGDIGPRLTLIVCPKTVLSTWISQLDEHTVPGFLKVYLYYGERTANVKELQMYDIVLTTYSTLSAEKSFQESPIKKIEWWRIILDEAHAIRNVTAQQSAAVIDLKGKRRWAVTGTPIQNGSFDLFSLMAFLRFQPFSIKSYWQSLVQRPLNQGSASGLSRLQALMRTISLRRTKDLQIGNKSLIGIPPKTVETCFVELSAEEREQYDRMETDAKLAVNEFIYADSVMRNYSTVLHIILRLRQICNCMDLCPLDIRSLFPSSSLEDRIAGQSLKERLQRILKEEEIKWKQHSQCKWLCEGD
ncbi:putative SWI/SNF-related matrix-associated actin-dependent regulator of chromatin subfamily A member 3-like protein 1 [Cinnamomum micranthum f. kanehirae]|uniref:Putative SWI/SNF-related matrix-associated actin-dependent regulator of chromatin subfamily A member 3-like protein 1 n=1 Tax=Cinnamomum micranthum f. kanehirae TaxID=337451 RepID=A0A443NBW9_9MAGN|nr:putative SWI/SNF-related matrix-associated actin-dependent regulator of chromatin subfamily A member 3-like protein 1 [Cinnamomum micranthum f. kanehirae]